MLFVFHVASAPPFLFKLAGCATVALLLKKKKMTTAFPLTTGGVTAAAGTPIGVSSPGTLLDSRMLLVQSQNMALRLLVAEKHRSVKRLDAEISLARKEHQKLATSSQELRTLGRVLKRYLTSLVSSAPLF